MRRDHRSGKTVLMHREILAAPEGAETATVWTTAVKI
jgi:hypothetical protein